MLDDSAADNLPESDFMKAFKVASFEVAEDGAPLSSKKSGDSKKFWKNLLADSAEQEKQAELERLGKGMRERPHVSSSK